MHIKLNTILLFIIIFKLSYSQTENALLWEVSGNDLNESSYLYGTIHLLPKDEFVINDKIIQAFDRSNILITEIDLNISLKQQLEIAKDMYLPDNKTYADYLSVNEIGEVKTFLIDSLHVKKRKLKVIFRIKPFFSSSLILKEYYGKIKSYEIELKKLAKKRKMGFGHLETIEKQMKIVNDMSLEKQFENIASDISSIVEFDKMIDCYQEEDLDCLKEMVFSSDEIDNFVEDFLYSRNAEWIPKIESYIKAQTSFIAFGAGHLVGEKGVVQLLRDKGYKLTPVLK
jgi:uncharacterized protein